MFIEELLKAHIEALNANTKAVMALTAKIEATGQPAQKPEVVMPNIQLNEMLATPTEPEADYTPKAETAKDYQLSELPPLINKVLKVKGKQVVADLLAKHEVAKVSEANQATLNAIANELISLGGV